MAAKDRAPVPKATSTVYQLRIALRRIRPPIWRRVVVPGNVSLARLHEVVQIVFGWTDTHLHQFEIAGSVYGQPNDFDDPEVMDETAVTLDDVVGRRTRRFTYIYDFGDDWVHDVAVEKIIAGDSGTDRALCLAGRRHRPPEDCGGVAGYREFLRAIGNPKHAAHDERLAWVGGKFDPEAFDLARVNRELGTLRRAAGFGIIQ